MDDAIQHIARTLRCCCLLGIGIIATHAAAAQETTKVVEPAQGSVRPYSPERVTQRTLYSKTGRRFQVTIALPQAPAPQGGYPVFYVLDPQSSFATLVETARNHEEMFGPVIVVGVGYETEAEQRNRIFDLTPPGTDVEKLPEMFRQGWGPMGGADAFVEFLANEVRPYLATTQKLDLHKQALFGHSLGGLFVLHVLFTKPELFDVFVAGSPSIWWSNKLLLNELPAFKARFEKEGLRKRLLIAMGGLEFQTNPEELRLIRRMNLKGAEDLPRVVDMLGNAAALTKELKPFAGKGLEVQYVVFPDETHNSVIPAYLGRGSRFTLGGWSKPFSVSRKECATPVVNDTPLSCAR